MHTKRRALLTEPGEPLIVSLSPIESAIRYGRFAEATGVPRTALTVSALCSIPLPVYPAGFDGPRRWSGVRPEAMWHPLLWMPSRVADRYQVGDSPSDLEDDDLWSVRVALEMSASGLYDDSSGTWVDILALIDIDVDTDSGRERVRRWLGGEADTDLDGLAGQVEGLLELSEADADWAAQTAAEALDALRVSAWAFTADSLFDICQDLRISHDAGERRDEMNWALDMIANFALVTFINAPADVDAGVREQMYWRSTLERLASLPIGDEIASFAMLNDMQSRLGGVRDIYWPQMLAQAESAS